MNEKFDQVEYPDEYIWIGDLTYSEFRYFCHWNSKCRGRVLYSTVQDHIQWRYPVWIRRDEFLSSCLQA